ncbi:MAG: bifunctional nuclease family protein [Bacteroidetes bacterium]|nr:bifunctional nuclease family protein [Bacteroidota bacterium]
MDLIQLTIKGISYSQTQNGAYALILNEMNGERKLPIVIGAFEAQSIAIALEKDIIPPRPLTHDLFKNFADIFGITIVEVIIHKLVDGVFYSSIVCRSNDKEEVIDARTSDAIALALRFRAPIYTHKTILEKAGIYLKSTDKEDEEEVEEAPIDDVTLGKSDYSKMNIKELNQLLEDAVKNENYEIAAKIRDEISKRQ